MWRRTYLLLLLVRIYFAISPSYLHPDENFQGPEVIAGHLFPYPSHRTWEWTSAEPVRSVFPLWPVYGIPMTLLKWVWAEDVVGTVSPAAIYYTLRMVMFALSFVLEDWAIHELVPSPRYRSQAVVLVASSYVTWTLQTHTFSNSVETLLVAWSLVLIERIVSEKKRSSIPSSLILGFLLAFGLFNRITFPAFILIPGLRLLPHFLDRPFSFCAIFLSGLLTTFVAVATDTAFYHGSESTKSFAALFGALRHSPVITPLNNLRYNSQTSNLAEHGLHPHYQHFFVNMPQLLGPAMILLITLDYPMTKDKIMAVLSNSRLTAAATGTLILSLIPHQEPRFLLPCIPLLLTCVRLPYRSDWRRLFWISWIIFNAALGILMGVYHQGGVVPAQIAIPDLVQSMNASVSQVEVFWWKTYPPPTYLLGAHGKGAAVEISSVSSMGMPQAELLQTLSDNLEKYGASCGGPSLIPSFLKTTKDFYIAAPLSAWRSGKPFDTNDLSFVTDRPALNLTHLATFPKHINLDDMDFGADGVYNTLARIVGRRGLGVWHVGRSCPP